MSRTTPTRVRVRELAEQLVLAGEAPSPTRIRAMLGTGSPNTIVSELKAWVKDRSITETAAALVAAPASKPGHPPVARTPTAAPASEPIEATKDGATAPAPGAALPLDREDLLEVIAQISAQLAQLNTKSTTLVTSLADYREATKAELLAIGARFEGVQKYMLMQINEAREESIRWRQKHQQARDEFGQWQTTVRQKTDALASENAWLRGRLNEPRPPVGAESANAPPTAISTPARAPGYPGHPHAVAPHSE